MFWINTVFFQFSPFCARRQVSWLRSQFPSLDIEVDGGVGPDTIHKCAEVKALQLRVWICFLSRVLHLLSCPGGGEHDRVGQRRDRQRRPALRHRAPAHCGGRGDPEALAGPLTRPDRKGRGVDSSGAVEAEYSAGGAELCLFGLDRIKDEAQTSESHLGTGSRIMKFKIGAKFMLEKKTAATFQKNNPVMFQSFMETY